MTSTLEDTFTTIYPFSFYLLPAIYVLALLLVAWFGLKKLLEHEDGDVGFKQIIVGIPLVLISVVGLVGISLTGFMNWQDGPERLVQGRVVDAGTTGMLGVHENQITEQQAVLLETADGNLHGPLPVTTDGLYYAIGQHVTLSCDIPDQSLNMSCDVVDIAGFAPPVETPEGTESEVAPE